LRDRRHPRLGVTHGGGVIAVDIAEIALALDQRIARGEILGEADQGLVNRDVAMGMEFADHVADDAGAFFEPGGGIESQLLHGVEQPAMHRLQPVPRIGEGACHDGGKRVGEITLAERICERRLMDAPGGWGVGDQDIGHRRLLAAFPYWLSSRSASCKTRW
jgi:hypothetical protein